MTFKTAKAIWSGTSQSPCPFYPLPTEVAFPLPAHQKEDFQGAKFVPVVK